MANHSSKERLCRRGMALMELLVVISIIGMLLSLLLPAVQAAREAGRRANCANNLRNIGLALTNVDNSRRRLPASGNFSFTGVGYHNWVVDILPYLERTDLYRQWDFDLPASDPNNTGIANHQLNVLICPDDDTVAQGQGNLSYVVNGGFGWTQPIDCPVIVHVPSANNLQTVPIDLNGNGIICPGAEATDGSPSDKMLFFWTGLFFPENWPIGSFTVRHRSLGDVSDGLSEATKGDRSIIDRRQSRC